MRSVVVLVAASTVLVAALTAQEMPKFRSATRTVVLHATARSDDGRLVPDLNKDAFTVLDNGRPVEISVFSNDPQPLTVALLIDMSGSMERHFLRVRDGMRELVNALHAGDRLRIGSFGEEVALSPHLTGDKQRLMRVLDEELWPGGGTPMWSAALTGMSSLAGEPGRRVVLVVTDGADNGQAMGFDGGAGEVRSRATNDDFMVYAIGIEGTGLEPQLKDIAEETGGGHFDLAAGDDLASTFARVVDELRHQYVLGFTPAVLDGRRHRLDVKLSDKRMSARARRNYVATPELPRR